MNAIEKMEITDTRQTVEFETRYNTFEVLMQRVDSGELTFEDAIRMYQVEEIGELATSM